MLMPGLCADVRHTGEGGDLTDTQAQTAGPAELCTVN